MGEREGEGEGEGGSGRERERKRGVMVGKWACPQRVTGTAAAEVSEGTPGKAIMV